MSLTVYDGDFRDLTGAVFASWFMFNPNGPTACAVGFVETADRPWSLFYRRMHPTGAKTYLGASIEQEISAAPSNFGEVFFGEDLAIGFTVRNLGAAPLQLAESPIVTGKPTIGLSLLTTTHRTPPP